MTDFRDLARDPEHRRSFEKLLYIAAQRGDAGIKEIDSIREEMKEDAREYLQYYWKARLRAARRVFNDPSQVEQIVAILEAAEGSGLDARQ